MPFVRVNHFYKSASPGQTIEVSAEEAELIVSRGGGVLLPGPAAANPPEPPAPEAPPPAADHENPSSETIAVAVEDADDSEPIDIPPETIAVADEDADDSEPIDILAKHGLSEKVLAALAEADIRTLAELRAVADVTELAGIGRATAAKITEALARHDHH